MCVAIAARACLLVLHRAELDQPLYPELDTIIVYPSTYRAKERRQEGYVVLEGEQARLGESWTRGVIVLSWDAVRAGGDDLSDGHDVVLHEFAHQLDAEGGAMDGTPDLGAWERYGVWARVANADYQALYAAVQQQQPTTLNPYGATNAPEFFAVAVEHFSSCLSSCHAIIPSSIARWSRSFALIRRSDFSPRPSARALPRD